MDDDGQIVMNYHAYRGKLTNHQIKKAHLGSQTYFRTESIVLTYKAFSRYQHSISRAWLGYLCFLLSRGFVVVFYYTFIEYYFDYINWLLLYQFIVLDGIPFTEQ